jgi:signal peptidase I
VGIAQAYEVDGPSMEPTLLTGEKLFVARCAYGLALPWLSEALLMWALPEVGDVVILASPQDPSEDLVKRVIGLPGDVIRMVNGTLIINGEPVKRERETPRLIPIDINSPCGSEHDPALTDFRVQGADGKGYCKVPIVRETLPSGRTYETVELGRSPEDNFGPVRIPAGHVWLMGDNRDDSADSRVPEWQGGLGGPVPWENIGGRAEFITFSLDGSTKWWNPLTWFEALRSGRAGKSLRNS